MNASSVEQLIAHAYQLIGQFCTIKHIIRVVGQLNRQYLKLKRVVNIYKNHNQDDAIRGWTFLFVLGISLG